MSAANPTQMGMVGMHGDTWQSFSGGADTGSGIAVGSVTTSEPYYNFLHVCPFTCRSGSTNIGFSRSKTVVPASTTCSSREDPSSIFT